MNHVTIEGKKHFVNFSMNAIGLYCEKYKISIKAFEESFTGGNIGNMTPNQLIYLVYTGLKDGHRKALRKGFLPNGSELEIEPEDIGDLITDEPEKFAEIMRVFQEQQARGGGEKKPRAGKQK